MMSRVILGLLSAAWVVACGGEKQRGSEGTKDAPSLPAECRDLRSLPPAVLVDDFEDGDDLLDTRAGLQGIWYVENDGTGRQDPPVGERAPGLLVEPRGAPASDAYALHMSATGFSGWGAFVGVRLNAAQRQTCTVDVSASTGLAILARGAGSVRVNFATPYTTPEADGGDCASSACSDFGAVLSLDGDYRAYEIDFDELAQPDWATPAVWDAQRLLRLSFWAEQGDLELWLDDVRFY